jgi:hypothetical protein
MLTSGGMLAIHAPISAAIRKPGTISQQGC